MKKFIMIGLLAFALLAGVTAVSAITILVDGVKETAWDGQGGQMPGIQMDGNEPGISDPYDIKEVRWTNDADNMYLLIETWGPFDADVDFVSQPIITICINVDNDIVTGRNVSGYCNNMEGVDRRINIFPVDNVVEVRRPTGTNAWTLVTGPTRETAWLDEDDNLVADHPYIEVAVDLASLTITGASSCIVEMPTAVYYDNGIVDPEDSTPDNGTFNLSCGTPTAVTLQALGMDANNNGLVFGLILTLVAALAGATLLVARRQLASNKE